MRIRNAVKLFTTLEDLKDFVSSIPEHKDGMVYTSKDVQDEMDFIEKFNIIRNQITVAKIGEESFRIYGCDTYKAIMSLPFEKQLDHENYAVHITELYSEEGIKDLVKNIRIQNSYS